jgi:hypothetical protein
MAPAPGHRVAFRWPVVRLLARCRLCPCCSRVDLPGYRACGDSVLNVAVSSDRFGRLRGAVHAAHLRACRGPGLGRALLRESTFAFYAGGTLEIQRNLIARELGLL